MDLRKWWIKGLLVITSLFVFAGCEADQSGSGSASYDSSGKAASSYTPDQQSADHKKQPQNQTAQSNNRNVPGVTARVIKVVDGDTIDVSYLGKVTTVRMLLIDTPETHHPRLGVQPYGPEASRYAHQLMDGKTVRLELAENGGHDKYGRLLAYVYVGGKSVEELQLARGFARVAYVIPPNTKYVDRYRAVEAQAKKKKLGIWSVNDYAQDDGYHPEVMKGTKAYREVSGYIHSSESGSSTETPKTNVSGAFTPDSSGNCAGAIKGNVSARGKIYHMPSDPYYKVTRAEACFKSRKAAAQAGFRAAK
ncbi:nuclease [Sporolactobacillus sp. THM7-4]|nr:nuclease [Sporolactobacillus sp. THM7-4]